MKLSQHLLRFFTTRRAVIVLAGLLTTIVAITAIPLSPTRWVIAVLAASAAYSSLALLIGKEVWRQDTRYERLAARVGRRPRGAGTASAGATAVQDRGSAPTWRGSSESGPLVTVVVTAHDEQRFLQDCLDSVASQTWTKLECIVVDDASTDATAEVAAAAVRHDPRFTILHLEDNVGPSVARNVGLGQARGEFVTFLDGDDLLYPDAIERRVAALVGCRDPEWVVGSFCLWHTIPEEGELGLPKGGLAERTRVSWLDAVFDAPFIVSAPIIRRDALLAVEGFDRDARTAEDYDLWSRLLRRGYVFEPVNRVGVAYRQKRTSLYRRTSEEHARRTTTIYRGSLEPATPGPGPHPLDQPYYVYEAEIAAFRRSLIGFVNAVAAGDASGEKLLASGLVQDDAPYMLRVVDASAIVRNAVRRIERWSDVGFTGRSQALEAEVWSHLEPLWGLGPGERSPSSRPVDATEAVVGATGPTIETRTRVRQRRSVAASPVTAIAGAKRIFLMPESAYHVDELGPLAELAAAGGARPAFLVSDQRLPFVESQLERFAFPVFRYPVKDRHEDLIAEHAAAVVTMNDWGAARKIVEACNGVGVPTFGKVEGVQDFGDADVHWQRSAYGQVGTVLCQGRNDLEATSGDRVIVGSTRLERIWRQPEAKPPTDLVVLNVNFTYGVLDDVRDMWLSSAVAACRAAGRSYVISMHPAERAGLDDPNVAEVPMRHLLTRASTLVSRFSTVPFEAMARGVPFVYHNPHSEKVPTFHNPGGAFPVTASVEELTDALRQTRSWQPGYRDRARAFFEAQVDIDPERSSEERTWELLRDRLGL